MRTTLIMAATAALMAATPAFASDIVPQTFASGPGSAGTIQQQDMQRSALLSEQNNARNAQAAAAATNAAQHDATNSQMNPASVINPHG